MNGRLRELSSWTLLCGLAVVAGLPACRVSPDGAPEADISKRNVDPETLFAEAQRLQRAYRKDASERALVAYREARDAWIREGDQVSAAKASRGLGATHEQLGLLEDALSHYHEAATLCRETCGPLLESALSSDIGLVQASLADDETSQQSARRYCRDALSLAHEAGGAPEEAGALSCSGEVEYHRGNLDEALRLHVEARTIWEGIGATRELAEASFYVGAIRSDLSRFEEAEADLATALSLSTSSEDLRGEAIALTAIGRLELRRGEYQAALNHLGRALERLEPSGDLVWEASALGALANVYLDMGDAARARTHMHVALDRARNTGLVTAMWDLLLALGRIHLKLEVPERALPLFREALELAERTESDHWKRAYSFQQMSLPLQAIGEPEEALEHLERALELQASAEDPRLEAAIWMEMGNTQDLLRDHERAVSSFRRALVLHRASDNRIGEATALFGMARVAEREENLDEARAYVERALVVAESLRSEVESRALRSSYFASIFEFHELDIGVLMQLHERRPEEGFAAAAFGASERARARSLLESLIETGVDIRAGVDPELLEREANVKMRLYSAIERRMRSEEMRDPKEARALDAEINELEATYDLVLAGIRSASPRYSALIRREPLTLAEVQDQLLDHDTVLLEYALGEKRSFVWAVAKDGYASFELGPRAEIEDDAQRLYELLTARADGAMESLQQRRRRLAETDAAYWRESARFSERLLGPVEGWIEGKKLIVVPDGALQHVPFAALPVSRGANPNDAIPRIAVQEVVNLPSASALAVLRQETLGREEPKGTVAVFADPVFTADDPRLEPEDMASRRRKVLPGSGELRPPRLVATRQEAALILTLASTGTTFQAMGFDATRSEATSERMGQYRILHFATHGVSNVDSPTMSGILLSMFDRHGRPQDGFLRLHDIYDLDLSADLVVLSACNTALGKQVRGEGTVGIVRAFMYAGAKRAVATLWKVDDEATRELMIRFYRGMFQEQLSPSAALRSAQLSMWRESEWRAPFFWGGFVLQGEWR